MESKPLVSIVTPSYNQAAFLEQTLRSVLDQDYPNLEYIVVDGGSTDGSPAIIERYADRLAWWVSERDRGQADGINKGFARANGEIIAWVNSDDLYLPGAISAAVAALQADPRAGMVFGDVRSIDSDGKAFNIMRFGNYGLEDLMTFHIIGQPAVFLRRSVLEQAGYLDQRFDLLLDHQLWLRVAQVTTLKYVPVQWAAARYHAAAKNVAQAPHYGKDAYAVIEWMKTQPALAARMQRIERRVWAGAHLFNAHYLLDGGLTRAALQAYWKSMIAHPPTGLKETHRILYAIFSPFGLAWLKPAYLGLRKRLKGLSA